MNHHDNHRRPNLFLITLFCFMSSVFILTAGKGLLHIMERVMPTHNKIEDLQLSDMCMAYGRGSSYDTRILIVDCSTDDRGQIAAKIEKIAACSPAAIGVDVTFDDPAAPEKNAALIKVLETHKDKITLVSAEHNPLYCRLTLDGASPGEGYIIIEPQDRTLRTFLPFRKTEENTIDTFFSVKVALAVKKESELPWLMYPKASKRELIDFKIGPGDRSRYDVVTVADDTAIFRNKIVLIGTMSDRSENDKHYSPLNGHFGLGRPDMFGVEYHAQIISMILNGEQLVPLHSALKYLFIFVCCLLVVQIDTWVANRWHKSHHLIMHGIFAVLVFLFLAVCVVGLGRHILIEPMDYIMPIILSINIIPLYDILSGWAYKIAKKFIAYHEKNV